MLEINSYMFICLENLGCVGLSHYSKQNYWQNTFPASYGTLDILCKTSLRCDVESISFRANENNITSENGEPAFLEARLTDVNIHTER